MSPSAHLNPMGVLSIHGTVCIQFISQPSVHVAVLLSIVLCVVPLDHVISIKVNLSTPCVYVFSVEQRALPV